MSILRNNILLFNIMLVFYCTSLNAEIYGGGYWETIGIGNMPCNVLLSNNQNTDYKEVASVWVSGFLTGVNFSSKNIYDITKGKDIYLLTNKLISDCKIFPDKTLSDIVTEWAYKKYQEQDYTPANKTKNK